jgi:hypothetical protein
MSILIDIKKLGGALLFNKKVLIGTIIFFLVVFIGFIQINIVNTRALSPIGNGEDNYEIVKEEFGEDFEEFIKDNAEVKIYKSNNENESPTIKIGEKDLRINTNNPITNKFYMLGSSIYNSFTSIKNKINGKIKGNNDENKNSEEKNSNNENSSINTNKDKLDNIVDDFLENQVNYSN